MNDYQATIYTAHNGQWQVGIRMKNGLIAITDSTRYASEASATLAAKRMKSAKPFFDYAVVHA